MKKVISILLFISIGLFLSTTFPTDVNACSCAERPSVESEFQRSQAVFSGKVVDVMEKRSIKGFMSKSVLFEVSETWKGVKQSQVIIATGQGGGDCGIDFKVGNDYLVYAHESDMYGAKSLISIICDRTSELSTSQEDLEFLGEGKPPTETVDLTDKQESSHQYIWIAAILVIAIVFIAVFKIMRKNK
ncbi:hypothetical protein [Cytobacillus dafuensis]|uniref:Tissue inhibitor of metalloproteinase n=1 Tax=Cytobacillus dafuensis TaxID=1742359 RepID=A0A5B8Z215_CYTDA|nr:hypothetical protein [Cytobacillus dafuensis]QED46928.1 hypothetical protein FSZ17_06395 [Cytobacillus dafuensis]